jgi:transcriptional regulator with XRE-family HTH domain
VSSLQHVRQVEASAEAWLAEFGERIRRRRDDLGIKQTELARQLGIARPTLANFEAGRRSPDLIIVFYAARYLDTTVSTLLGEGSQLRALDSERVVDEAVDLALGEFRIELKRTLRRGVQDT